MKRGILSMALVIAMSGLVTLARAEDKKVTLKGDLVCAQCALKEKDAKECANVLVVKEGDKETRYYLVHNDASKKFDSKTCGGGKTAVTITGSVADKDGKKVLTATKIDG